MTISDKDHFVLLKTISGIKEEVRKMSTFGNDDLMEMRNNFNSMLQQLIDVCNELHTEEELRV